MDKGAVEYRPNSYWIAPDPRSVIKNQVKGTARRDLIDRSLEDGSLEDIPDELLEDTLNENVRRATGSLHPKMMGGEYLPDYLPDEVEIARICLSSTTYDVISVRARRSGKKIAYRVVDEYWDEGTTFILKRQESDFPLSLAGLIDLIDTTQQDRAGEKLEKLGLTTVFRELNLESLPENLVSFVSVESEFYPALGDHYRREAMAWFVEKYLEWYDGCISPPSWKWEGGRLIDSVGNEIVTANNPEPICMKLRYSDNMDAELIRLSPEILDTLLRGVVENWRDLSLDVVSKAAGFCRQLCPSGRE